MPDTEPSAFSKKAKGKQRGAVAELWLFLTQNKKWWLAPIVIVLFAVGLLAVLGGSGVAPFIYTLF